MDICRNCMIAIAIFAAALLFGALTCGVTGKAKDKFNDILTNVLFFGLIGAAIYYYYM